MDDRRDRIPRAAALAAIAVGAAFVCWVGSALPDPVASHFSSSGAADGRMSRPAFVALMLALGSAMPAAMLFWLRSLRAPARPAVPVIGGWSAPMGSGGRVVGPWAAASFAVGLAAFMDFVAWLACRANAAAAPSLPPSDVMPGVLTFVAFVAAWGVAVSLRRR